jgi:internalin A
MLYRISTPSLRLSVVLPTERHAAHNEALQRIRLAHKSGAGELSLADLALERLPEELSDLTVLTTLQVDGCLELKDLSALRPCTRLAVLDLRACPQVMDLNPLRGLHALRELRLGVRDWEAFVGPSYVSMEPRSALGDIDVLTDLAALVTLTLGGCDRVSSFQPLAGLTALQHLNLGGCGQLQDLQPLATLTALQHLDLSRCEQLRNLQPLAGLTALQHLDLGGCEQLRNLQPLAGLTALQSLYLSGCKQLQDLQPLAGLTALQHLDLGWCEQLRNLQPLAGLTGLKTVNLFDASLLDCSPAAQPLASWTALEGLFANRLIAAPSELGSSDQYMNNALPRLRGWQADLAAGEAPNSTVKLFVLGNSRVGKTQICRRLCGEGFDPSIPSTHGISLGQLRLAGPSGDQPAVDAHFWDFGGQDVYLGTHALFLDERAIYVIAWTPQHENIKESEQDGVPLRNRSLAYWLEYVHSLAGPQAPVIVVQAQCDRELDVRPAPVPAEHGFKRLRVTSSSAKQDEGMERLQLELKSAAHYQLERYGKVRLPASWVAVGEELRARRDWSKHHGPSLHSGLHHMVWKALFYFAPGQFRNRKSVKHLRPVPARISEKSLPRADFDELCHTKHGSAVPGVVLEYLHRSGQVFWREGLFGNQVVLDLAWALAGVYAVLERNTALPEIRRQAGRFSPQLLGALVWRDYGEAERKLFLSLMEQCQICFKVTEEVFIAPALLPVRAAMESVMQQVWREAAPDAVVRLDYAFLHEGVVRAMLCSIGEKAGVHAVYWAYGVCFYDAERKSTVRIGSDLPDVAAGQAGGRITVEAAGPQTPCRWQSTLWSRSCD